MTQGPKGPVLITPYSTTDRASLGESCHIAPCLKSLTFDTLGIKPKTLSFDSKDCQPGAQPITLSPSHNTGALFFF